MDTNRRIFIIVINYVYSQTVSKLSQEILIVCLGDKEKKILKNYVFKKCFRKIYKFRKNISKG